MKASPSMPFLTEVEWLHNDYDGDANAVPYIATDITASWDLPFEYMATITKPTANRIFLCGNYPNRLTFYIEVTATNRLRFGSQDSTADDPAFAAFDIYTNSSYPIPLNVPTKVWVKYNPLNDANHTVKYEIGLEALDGSVTRTETGTFYRAGSPSADARKKLNIFNDYRSAIATADGGFKMHQCEIKMGTAHKKFIPCLDLNRLPCMYEQIEGKLYYNSGTGGFNVGRRIVEVEYMNLTGWQRFNTGFIANTLRTTLKTNFTYESTTAAMMMGTRQRASYPESCSFYIPAPNTSFPYSRMREDWAADTGTAVYSAAFTSNDHTVEITCGYAKVDGVVTTDTATSDYTMSKPWWFGCVYTINTDTFQYYQVGKIYFVELLDTYTREQYRYCVPAHDENNIGFFFDRVNHFVIENGGSHTEDMTWGDEIHPVGFLYGGSPDRFNTGIPFYNHKWETDVRYNAVRNDMNLMGVAAGACNYWGVLSNGSAALYGQYSLHTSNAEFGLNIDPTETRTVFLDSYRNNADTYDMLSMTVEGQSVTRSTSEANRTTGYRIPDFSTSYPEPAYIYGNRCYDRTTNEVLQNAIIVQNGQKQPSLFDTVTHTRIDTISSGTTIKLGAGTLGYNTEPQLPYGFVEVDYLESTGTQYLNTGITPTNTMGIEVKYAYPEISSSANAGVCGTYQATAPRTDTLFVTTQTGQTDSKICLIHGGQSYLINVLPTANTWYNAKINWLNDGKINLDDTYITDAGTNGVENNKLILFGRVKASDDSIAKSVTRICKYIVSDGLRITHNYVPVIRLYDKKVGMFDLITREFLTNAGTGEFLVGINNVSYLPVDYIESSGQQYIDTGLKIDDSCGFYVDAEKTVSSDSIIIGVKGSGHSRWAYNPSTTNMNVSWNTIYTASTGSVLGRHKVKLNVFNDRQRTYDLTVKDAITDTLSKNASTYNVCLFGAKWGSETVQLLSSCKMYSAFITKGMDFIAWYLPMVRYSDSKAGMIDMVSRTFLTNGGSGADFTYPVSYIPNKVLVSSNSGEIDTSSVGSGNLAYLDGLTSNAEQTGNKTTTINSSSTDTQYPSAKAVYDLINN